MFILKFLWNRITEPSTWAGALLVNEAFGLYPLTGYQAYAIGAFGMALCGSPDEMIDKLKYRIGRMKN